MWDWRELETMSGEASGIPSVLQQLLHGTAEQRAKAFRSLYGKVANQGDLYTSAAGVTDTILNDLRLGRYIPEFGWLMLHEIFRSFGRDKYLMIDGHPIEIDAYCRERILETLPVIDEVATNLSGKDFEYAAFLLGDIGEYSNQAIAILEREVSRSSGERLQSARDQLEVATELARERELNGGNTQATGTDESE
ncbi:hypothetical protein [Spongiactinospora sp. TRM90649]|uniref:hypothetical protein n=1 Tax=Spongiactinospora sp. TRM90649 TaxID=3031114 RepID=UPI0023F66B9A|nr:hypothetical protein [Spongiactinospora sp. TRM90649]MDF5756465.1 hypothetical protein [Spongiactinospora sp. TRM90649]